MRHFLLPNPGRALPRSSHRTTAVCEALLDLVRLRVAQIHESDIGETYYRGKLRQAGESKARLDELESWPVSRTYTGKERVALGLAELLARPLPEESTLLPHLLRHARRRFSRAELLELAVTVEAMQDWEHREQVHA